MIKRNVVNIAARKGLPLKMDDDSSVNDDPNPSSPNKEGRNIIAVSAWSSCAQRRWRGAWLATWCRRDGEQRRGLPSAEHGAALRRFERCPRRRVGRCQLSGLCGPVEIVVGWPGRSGETKREDFTGPRRLVQTWTLLRDMRRET
ncbi:hypothetical protein NDU88_006192 [Pleurodeles waltl]|uniref:Uncharacterized protein n=1 Tax=Pleurodeles waltl TaxID=8319 RepID=A0AAV7SNT1_PLEWA|nr:hypothetical protein NDU88_006192 [Pleurodeles waltl]